MPATIHCRRCHMCRFKARRSEAWPPPTDKYNPHTDNLNPCRSWPCQRQYTADDAKCADLKPADRRHGLLLQTNTTPTPITYTPVGAGHASDNTLQTMPYVQI